MEEREKRVREIIAENLGQNIEAVTDESRIMEDLGADSLDGVEIVMALEEEFDIAITDEAAEGLKTVKDFIDIVGKLAGDQ